MNQRAMKLTGLLFLGVMAGVLGCDNKNQGGAGGGSGGKPRIAYITNGVDPFWVIAEKGAKDAGEKFGANVTIVMPNGSTEQKQKLEDQLIKGTDGIAISPIDAANQTPMIDEAAGKTNIITHDSDAPKSKRLFYIGMDNYLAGRMAGKLVKEAIPNGGKVAIFVGRLEQDNGRLRRQGLIDELMDRSEDKTRNEPPSAEVKNDKYTILATKTDQFDRSKAKSNAEDVMVAHPDLACMVGLFAYNPPNCLEALKKLNKQGKIQLVAFDEQDATLQAIKDGHCFGTIVQNPYMYGYESVRTLAALKNGDKSVIPSNPEKMMNIPARAIKKDAVDEFWTDLKKKTAK